MVLLPERDGITWVDNFFAVGQDEDDAARRFAGFRHRADLVGAELNRDQEYGIPRQRFTALGLEFDLAATLNATGLLLGGWMSSWGPRELGRSSVTQP